MAFQSLLNRLTNLPLVLCGPILRKTTSNEVCVWIALRCPASLSLDVYNEHTNSLVSGGTVTVTTARIGVNIHVYLLRKSGISLSPSINYGYDINFTPTGGYPYSSSGLTNFTSVRNLSGIDILTKGANGISKLIITGSPFTSRPNFSLPPAANNFNKFRAIHGSCRKPHGQSHDAMEGIHDMINSVYVNNSSSFIDIADKRPQQLFLTGDQVYVDDVADCMLHMVHDASVVLFAGSESIPTMTYQLNTRPNSLDLAVGHRSFTINTLAKFSVDGYACKSHLTYLGEFYCMYLFAWSPELWPQNSADLPEWNQIFTLNSMVILNANPEQHFLKFDEERKCVTAFHETLGLARKVLANIPTYMLIDDHEVTDDWNMNPIWFARANSTNLGKRIISNALSAYAIFQDLGNQPLQYSSGAGATLLNDLTIVPGNNSTPNFNSVQTALLPTINNTNTFDEYLEPPASGIRWNYKISFADHDIIAIDIRTMRGFGDEDDGYPDLIHKNYLSTQIPPNTANRALTFILSPSPIFGAPYFESLKLFKSKDYNGVVGSDAEDWGLRQNYGFQDLLSHLTRLSPGSSSQCRIIALSGDVHFAFSARAQYWATKPFGRVTGTYDMIIAQLNASSFKNEELGVTKTSSAHALGYAVKVPLLIDETREVIRFGYDAPGNGLQIGTETITIGAGSPTTTNVKVWLSPTLRKVHDLEDYSENIGTQQVPLIKNYNRTINIQPQWRYQVDYQTDGTSIIARLNSAIANASIGSASNKEGVLDEILKIISNLKKIHNSWGPGREVVGYNNFGEVTLNWTTGPKVIHTIWWRINRNLSNRLPVQPLTIHEIPLSYSAISQPTF